MLIKQHYAIVGNHSAVKICHWTKESLLHGRVCYKEKFYGIKSHRCLQMTPAVSWCTHNCIFCWRPVEYGAGAELNLPVDSPELILKEAIKAQRKLLIGYKGHPDGIDINKLEESFSPINVAISLSGEPTLYPYLSELMELMHRRGMITFLVTNGTTDLSALKTLPRQLYLSLDAPDEETYKIVDRPSKKAGWNKINESLLTLRDLNAKTRTVIRLTLMRKFNMKNPEGYAREILKAEPLYIELKAYMHVGYSRLRIQRSEMPSHQEIKEFAEKISELTGYSYLDESTESRVVLLKR